MTSYRTFTGDTLVIASHNAGKLREIGELLKPFGVTTKSVADLGLPVPIEDGTTFIENARIKSLAAAIATGYPALSDDSGIEITALDGKPGIHTADWAGEPRDWNRAMQRAQNELGDAPDRSARFCCALSLAWPDDHTEDFLGFVEGDVVWPLRGDVGFGYDPMFQPKGETRTFSEMRPDEKQAISHRAHAFKQLIEACFAGRN